MNVPDEPRVPRFVKWIAVIVLGGIVAVSFTAHQTSSIRSHEDHRDCRRAVAERDDDRAMWLYAIELSPDRADDPDVVAFVEFLNERLPPLRCDGSTPTPIPSTTSEDS